MTLEDTKKLLEFTVTRDEDGERLDIFLSGQNILPTRSQVKRAVDEGMVWVDGVAVKPGHRLRAGNTVVVRQRCELQELALVPEDIPLEIPYEDSSIIVVNKPYGMVVHPAAGNYHGTLVNALLFHCKDLAGIGGTLRPGIVHRLDKNTSGLMVAAKSDEAHIGLAKQFKDHLVKKIYKVLVHGDTKEEEGFVDLSIGRHPSDRKKMSPQSRRGKEALTLWRVAERYGIVTLLDVRIKTGRTHQIRVHMNAIGHPVVGDEVYGNSKKRILAMKDGLPREILKKIKRQALHSSRIGFCHPVTGEYMEFSSSLPEDMAFVCEKLKEYIFDERV